MRSDSMDDIHNDLNTNGHNTTFFCKTCRAEEYFVVCRDIEECTEIIKDCKKLISYFAHAFSWFSYLVGISPTQKMPLSNSVWDVILLLMFFEGRFEKDLETPIKDAASFCGFKISVAHRKGLCEERPDLEEISCRQVVTFSVPVRSPVDDLCRR